MSCPYCKYEGTNEDAAYLNENIYSDDDLMVCFMYDGGLSVWLNHDGVLCCSKYVPVNYCPMCGGRLDGKD